LKIGREEKRREGDVLCGRPYFVLDVCHHLSSTRAAVYGGRPTAQQRDGDGVCVEVVCLGGDDLL